MASANRDTASLCQRSTPRADQGQPRGNRFGLGVQRPRSSPGGPWPSHCCPTVASLSRRTSNNLVATSDAAQAFPKLFLSLLSLPRPLANRSFIGLTQKTPDGGRVQSPLPP